jgi:predicted secreted protein
MIKRHSAEEEESLRRYIQSEEDRATLTAEKWNGGYRWFRSENVVCIEHYRAAETKQTPRQKAS